MDYLFRKERRWPTMQHFGTLTPADEFPRELPSVPYRKPRIVREELARILMASPRQNCHRLSSGFKAIEMSHNPHKSRRRPAVPAPAFPTRRSYRDIFITRNNAKHRSDEIPTYTVYIPRYPLLYLPHLSGLIPRATSNSLAPSPRIQHHQTISINTVLYNSLFTLFPSVSPTLPIVEIEGCLSDTIFPHNSPIVDLNSQNGRKNPLGFLTAHFGGDAILSR
jgi:hypothetical protein